MLYKTTVHSLFSTLASPCFRCQWASLQTVSDHWVHKVKIIIPGAIHREEGKCLEIETNQCVYFCSDLFLLVRLVSFICETTLQNCDIAARRIDRLLQLRISNMCFAYEQSATHSVQRACER